MTQDHQNVSRHFTQIMALVDRVNCEHLLDEPVGHLVNIENGEFLPSVEDNYTLRKDMIQVVSNILVESLPSFKVFKNIYPSHFEHIYSKDMAKKSTVVYPYSMVLLKAPYVPGILAVNLLCISMKIEFSRGSGLTLLPLDIRTCSIQYLVFDILNYSCSCLLVFRNFTFFHVTIITYNLY